MSWPLSNRETLMTFVLALAAIYVANATGVLKQVTG